MPSEQIVARAEELAACCQHLAENPVIGFDTEFIGEQTFVPQLCLIQVATPERLILIDPLTVGDLAAFWEVVSDPKRTVVAHAAREEIRICQRSCGRLPHGVFDLQVAAGLVGLGYPLGHGPLVGKVLGIRLNKGETLTDWKKRPLTQKQIQYAFDDVRHLLPLWEALRGKLVQLERLEWAREEFEALLPRSLGEEPGVERWRRLKGLGGLDRRKLGLVRELHAWREEKAYEKNRPVRTIVRDDLLVEIAKRNPKTDHDLEVVRGLAKKDVPEILSVVQYARTMPAESLPEVQAREDDPPPVTLTANLLGAVLGDLCVKMQLSQGLVATANDVKLLVRAAARGEPPPPECVLADGWRSRAVLPELQAVLEGKRCVRVADLRRDDPLEVTEPLAASRSLGEGKCSPAAAERDAASG
jgi:ribonuclease D